MSQAVFEGHRTYRVRGAGVAAVVAVCAAAVGLTALAALSWATRVSVDRAGPGGRLATASMFEMLSVVAGVVFVALETVALVLTIIWLWRARKNLDAFPDTEPYMSAGWAIGGWFLPIANLFVPGRVMANVARQSSRERSVTVAANVWWVSLVASMLVNRLASGMASAPLESAPTLSDYYGNVAVAETVAALPGLLAAAAFAFAVPRISAAQEERIHRGWYEEQHRAFQAAHPPAAEAPANVTDRSPYAPDGAGGAADGIAGTPEAAGAGRASAGDPVTGLTPRPGAPDGGGSANIGA